MRQRGHFKIFSELLFSLIKQHTICNNIIIFSDPKSLKLKARTLSLTSGTFFHVMKYQTKKNFLSKLIDSQQYMAKRSPPLLFFHVKSLKKRRKGIISRTKSQPLKLVKNRGIRKEKSLKKITFKLGTFSSIYPFLEHMSLAQ